MIFHRFLCHFLLHSSRGCLGRAAESLWVSNPAGSPVPAVDLQFQPWHGVLCSFVVEGGSCRAVLIIPITGMSISPPSADLRCLWWQWWGRWQGLEGQVTSLSEGRAAGLLCVILQSLGTFPVCQLVFTGTAGGCSLLGDGDCTALAVLTANIESQAGL